MRTAADLVAAAERAGLHVDSIERVPVAGGGTELAATMSFEDPWAAARLLFELSEEDAGDPVVRAWSLDMLRATAAELGEQVGPSITPELRDAFARTIHANVQQQIKFVHEPKETFQAARVTMQTKAGDCDDHARLVYALARAGGVPTELIFFEQDDQPIHVVDRMQDADGTWQWAETTIDADYGEEPHEALARLGESVSVDGNPFAQGPIWPSLGAAAAPATPSHGFVSVADVLAYRRTWDAFVVGTAHAAIACAEALEAAAAAPGASDPDLLRLAADTERENADTLMVRWNLHANTPDYAIVLGAGDILVDQQDAVEKAATFYRPQIVKDCPTIALPSPPSVDVQSQIIGRIEGFGILAHGVLQLIGIGTGGALDTLGPIVRPSPAAISTVQTLAIAAAVVAAGLAVREVARASR